MALSSPTVREAVPLPPRTFERPRFRPVFTRLRVAPSATFDCAAATHSRIFRDSTLHSLSVKVGRRTAFADGALPVGITVR